MVILSSANRRIRHNRAQIYGTLAARLREVLADLAAV